MTIRLRFDPRDIWIGVRWTTAVSGLLLWQFLDLYICLCPMFPLHLGFRRPMSEKARDRWLAAGFTPMGEA